MAERSVVMDVQLRYFEASVPGIEVALRDGLVAPVLSHYGGDFATANIYKPVGDRTLKSLRATFGASALTPIREGRGGRMLSEQQAAIEAEAQAYERRGNAALANGRTYLAKRQFIIADEIRRQGGRSVRHLTHPPVSR